MFLAVEAFGSADHPDAANLPLAEWNFEQHEGLIWIRADIDGQPLNFILDSASTMHVIDSTVAARLGLPSSDDQISVRRTGHCEGCCLTSAVDLKIGEIRLGQTPLLSMPLNEASSKQKRIDGIIGSPLFEHYQVQIDYKKSKIRLFSKGIAQKHDSAIAIPLQTSDGLVGLSLRDKSGREGVFVLDTGSTQGVLVSPHAVRNFAVKGPSQNRSVDAGGIMQTCCYPRTTWMIGPQLVAHLETMLCRLPAEGLLADDRWSGIVGNRFLSNFKVTFDLSAGCVLLEPAS